SGRSSPACPWPGHKTSSCPCSPVQWPILPDCFFPVCVSALRFLSLDAPTGASATLPTLTLPGGPDLCFPDPAHSLPDSAGTSSFMHNGRAAAVGLKRREATENGKSGRPFQTS